MLSNSLILKEAANCTKEGVLILIMTTLHLLLRFLTQAQQKKAGPAWDAIVALRMEKLIMAQTI